MLARYSLLALTAVAVGATTAWGHSGATGSATQMTRDAETLSTAAKTASDISGIRAELLAVGRSCKACHQDFKLAK